VRFCWFCLRLSVWCVPCLAVEGEWHGLSDLYTSKTWRQVTDRVHKFLYFRCLTSRPTVSCHLLVSSLRGASHLFLKWKFFDFDELFGSDKLRWSRTFHGGDFVICRLTPEKYHYNHMPASGVVRDHYEIP